MPVKLRHCLNKEESWIDEKPGCMCKASNGSSVASFLMHWHSQAGQQTPGGAYIILHLCYATCTVCVITDCTVIYSILCFDTHVINDCIVICKIFQFTTNVAYAGMSKSTSSQQLLVHANHCP